MSLSDTYACWQAYDQMVRDAVGARYSGASSEAFAARGVHVGALAPDLTARLDQAIGGAEVNPFRAEDFMPGYLSYQFHPEVVAKLNETSTYYKCGGRLTWLIAEMLENIGDDVAGALGSPWRVVNVRVWDTQPEAEVMGPYAWHLDGFAEEIFKVMVYVTPLCAKSGGVEFKVGDEVVSCLSNPGGTWALFCNSSVSHRGVPGTQDIRRVIEVTLCRSAVLDVRPRIAGLNSHWPSRPWVDLLEGCPFELAQEIAQRSVPKWARKKVDFAVLGMEGFLRIAAFFAPLAALLTRRVVPGLSLRFSNLAEHARNGTMRHLAEHTLSRMSKRR